MSCTAQIPMPLWDNIGRFMLRRTKEGVTLRGPGAKPKGPAEPLFDMISPDDLNKFLRHYMNGITAKTFRTYNASTTLQRLLADVC